VETQRLKTGDKYPKGVDGVCWTLGNGRSQHGWCEDGGIWDRTSGICLVIFIFESGFSGTEFQHTITAGNGLGDTPPPVDPTFVSLSRTDVHGLVPKVLHALCGCFLKAVSIPGRAEKRDDTRAVDLD